MSVYAGPRPATVDPQPLSGVLAVLGPGCRVLQAESVAQGQPPGADVALTGVTHDSRQVLSGDLYAALSGANVHGADFVRQAVAAGAAAVLTDESGAARLGAVSVPVLVVADPRARLGDVAAFVYDNPAAEMLLIGVTGTNGKTTTCALLDSILQSAGHVTGLVGTIETRVADEVLDSIRTTPEATELHALLALMRERGVTACSMEVSSHGLELGRVAGMVFDAVGFTQLSQDHLDFHGDMESYYRAKRALFHPSRARAAVVCVDESWGRRLSEEAELPVTTLATTGSASGPADWRVLSSRPLSGRLGSEFELSSATEETPLTLTVPMAGQVNVANAALAAVLARQVGVSRQQVREGLETAEPVAGRMEPLSAPAGAGPLGVVDYAHTPDAVATALQTLRQHTRGRLLVVLGAGGDRDRGKRPLMGRAAGTWADVVVVTDDNPRSEDPAEIRREVLGGVADIPVADRAEVLEVGDRAEAIRAAVARSGPGDVVLVAGKGHETGQTIGAEVLPFDDRAVLAQALADPATTDSAVPTGRVEVPRRSE